MKSLFIIVYAFVFFSGCSIETNTSRKNQATINKIENISSKQAYEMINANKDNPNFNILDIRTPQEFQDGHIADSINIDYYSADFEYKIDNLDKNKIYLIYCRSGSRSNRAINLMKQKGFSEVYNITNGIIDWQQNKLPLIE